MESQGSTAANSWPHLGHFVSQDLQAFFDASPDGILVITDDGKRILLANPAACHMLGYTKEELLDDSPSRLPHPEHVEYFASLVRGRLAQHKVEACLLHKQGRPLVVDLSVTPLAFQEQPCHAIVFRDVTDQKQSLDALQASDQRYHLITENAADVIWAVDFPPMPTEALDNPTAADAFLDQVLEQWRFSYLSPAVEPVFGYTQSEAMQLRLADIATLESYRVLKSALQSILVRGLRNDWTPERIVEVELVARDGSSRWCEVVSTYLRGATGVPTGLIGITRDISARRHAESALHDSEETLRQLFENLPDFVVKITQYGLIVFANRGLPHTSRETLLGRSWFGMIPAEHNLACRKAIEQTLASRQTQTLVIRDIFGQWWSARFVPLLGNDQQLMVIATDITQERLASEAVNKERQLLRRLLERHERERQLVAYEIHDGFAQQLTGALFLLQAFRETLSKNSDSAWSSFDSAAMLLRHAIDETRRLISGLRPPILDELGIVEAIQYLIYENRTDDGPDVEFKHNLGEQRLDPNLENTVFRIVQESLRNAFCHSESELIAVSLCRRENELHLDVRDWGKGFDPTTTDEDHFGLQGIRERTRLLGGQVIIESAPGQGTRIAAHIPLMCSDAKGPTDDSNRR